MRSLKGYYKAAPTTLNGRFESKKTRAKKKGTGKAKLPNCLTYSLQPLV